MIYQRFIFVCDDPYCTSVHVRDNLEQIAVGSEALKPQLPMDWRYADYKILCPKHEISIDGRPIR